MCIPKRRQNTTSIAADSPTKFCSAMKTGSTHCELRTGGKVCYLWMPSFHFCVGLVTIVRLVCRYVDTAKILDQFLKVWPNNIIFFMSRLPPPFRFRLVTWRIMPDEVGPHIMQKRTITLLEQFNWKLKNADWPYAMVSCAIYRMQLFWHPAIVRR